MKKFNLFLSLFFAFFSFIVIAAEDTAPGLSSPNKESPHSPKNGTTPAADDSHKENAAKGGAVMHSPPFPNRPAFGRFGRYPGSGFGAGLGGGMPSGNNEYSAAGGWNSQQFGGRPTGFGQQHQMYSRGLGGGQQLSFGGTSALGSGVGGGFNAAGVGGGFSGFNSGVGGFSPHQQFGRSAGGYGITSPPQYGGQPGYGFLI